MLKPPLESGGGGHGGTTAKQGPRQFPTIYGVAESRKPEIPRQSTVPHTDENPTFHAVGTENGCLHG